MQDIRDLQYSVECICRRANLDLMILVGLDLDGEENQSPQSQNWFTALPCPVLFCYPKAEPNRPDPIHSISILSLASADR